jgi:predicted secreted hydrolase
MTRRTAGGPGRRSPSLAVLVAGALLVSACTTPILANPPLSFPSPVPPSAAPSTAPDPIPIAFPRDDGPHDRLTEWWYYTGHLHTDTGRRFGFEAVVFRAERGTVPPAWAAHLALTDESGSRFIYAQRNEIGTQVDRSPRDGSGAPTGFDLQIGGLSPTLVTAGAPASAAPWRLAGAGGTDRIEATLAPEEARAAGAAFGLNLDLKATKPAALHDGDGFVDFGLGGSSYYYSRTRLTATGTVQVDGEQLSADGIAWFDHQWGDFVSVGGGWDWFAINVDPIPERELGSQEITLSVVLGAAGEPVLRYGTTAWDDSATRIDGSQFEVETLGSWTSPETGRTWPSGWRVTLNDVVIDLAPTVLDQELDTRATTGVVYWEGSQRVSGSWGGAPISGEAYVEITRYGP